MHTRSLRWLLIGLLVATLLALLWNRYGMNSVLEISAQSIQDIVALDDRDAGGHSVASVARDDGKLVLDCTIGEAAEPICEMAIRLKNPPAGIDLSRYDTLLLALRYDAPPGQPLRFLIRNFNPAYSNPSDHASMKVEEIVFDPRRSRQPLEVRLSQFAVASWWSSERHLPVRYAGTEFDNVPVLSIATGENPARGVYRVALERIEFHGKLVPTDTFRLAVIGVWVLFILVHLAIDSAATRRQLLLSARSQASLRRLNAALRVQTQSVAKLACLDPLTGILNRNGLAEELVRLANDESDPLFPLSLVFLDIDHFKRINDRYGHNAGDEVIKNVVNIVKDNIQKRDLFARWGGEEFLLVFPGTQASEARLIAERLRELIAEDEPASGLRVTSSFGVAEWLPGEELTQSIARADSAMYRAKELGRNRVETEPA